MSLGFSDFYPCTVFLKQLALTRMYRSSENVVVTTTERQLTWMVGLLSYRIL
jgi:hypothetical protein